MKKEYKGTYLYSGFDIQHRCDLHRFGLIGSSSMKFGMKYVCDLRFSDANNSYMLGCYRIAQKVSLFRGL